jgi:hypothetical protein
MSLRIHTGAGEAVEPLPVSLSVWSANRKLSGIDSEISPVKSGSVDLSKLSGSVGGVTACPDNCSLFAGQVALREMWETRVYLQRLPR